MKSLNIVHRKKKIIIMKKKKNTVIPVHFLNAALNMQRTNTTTSVSTILFHRERKKPVVPALPSVYIYY